MQRDGSSSPDGTVKSGRRGRRRSKAKSKPRKDSDSRSKRDYIDEISLKTGLGRPLLKVVLNLLLDGIMRDLAEGKRVEFREFGAFMIQQRAPRRAQNPKTLEPVIVPARRIIKFKPGIRLRELIDDGEPVIRLYPPKPQEEGAQAAPETAAQRAPVQEPVESSVGAGPEASGSAEARTEPAPVVASPERSSELEARPHTGKRADTTQASGVAASDAAAPGAAASGAAPDTNGDAESRRDAQRPEVEATRAVRRQEYDRTDRSRAARAGQPINGALGQSRPAESLKPH